MELDPKILLVPCQSFDFTAPPFEPIEFAKDLMKTMYDHRGLGLAANQIGIPYRIFAMRGEPENFVMYNPRIVDVGEEVIDLEEGCLSYPNLFMKIARPKNIKVRFATPNGDVRTQVFTGMTARVVQHEMCHLDGRVFWDGVNRTIFERARKKAKLNVTYNGQIL